MRNSYIDRRCQDVEYAGFWVRLAAYCIDSAIVWIGLLFVKLVMGILSMGGGRVWEAHLLFQYSLRDIILYVIQALYFILLTFGTGSTPGKRLMNLRVVNADLSPDLTLINVVYRETVGRFLCGLSVGIGYIMAGVDREKKGLHDMICDTRVIYSKKIKVLPKYQAPSNYPPIPAPGPGPIPMPPYGNPPQGRPMCGTPYWEEATYGSRQQGNPPNGSDLPSGNNAQGNPPYTVPNILPPGSSPYGRDPKGENAVSAEGYHNLSQEEPAQQKDIPVPPAGQQDISKEKDQ